MKRKPTTKQTVKASLARLLPRELRTARESKSEYAVDAATNCAYGAIFLAYHSDVIDSATYDALCKLANSAAHERRVELIYDVPPYTGASRAKSKRYPATADSTSAGAGGTA